MLAEERMQQQKKKFEQWVEKDKHHKKPKKNLYVSVEEKKSGDVWLSVTTEE
jgi:hypothetical protein